MVGTRPAPRARQPGVRGVTLVEVLVVLVLIALLASTVVLGSGSLGASRLRAAATMIVALSRVAATRANSTGLPVRMTFDLGTQRIILEESNSGRVLREKESALDGQQNTAGATGEWVKAAESASEAATELFVEGISAPKPQFRPIPDLEINGEPMGGEGRHLGSGIEFRQVQTEHDEEPRTDGRAYLYFWPGGETEWASVQVRQRGKVDGLTILVSPLTGRARIQVGNQDLPDAGSDGTISELEELN